ncbi:MAG: AAA family ATPase [Burkholderiaceae bacterium]|nr:AAA family ATPase [Burkholderiaceae bacterium]
MDKNDALDAHALLVAALRDPTAYPQPVSAVEVIDTHISSVLLAGAYAYKLKKPVDLGFVDFSTLARRHHFCDEEIRLNRRSAPSLYLDVVPITSSPTDAKPRIGGEGAPLDYAVRMRRFAADARLDQIARAGTLDASLIDRLAATIAAFHSHCARAPEHNAFGTAETILAWARANLVELRRSIALQEQIQGQQRIDRLAQWTEAEFARRADVFATRRAEGFVRECHGDLHLANLALIDGEPVPFDCIEFNPELRFIDVMSDVAFTWMDLLDHGLPQLAARLLNGYLEVTGDYAGLATLRFYAVYRALVRALVALIRRGQPDSSAAEQMCQEQACARYLAVAERIMQVSPPLVLLVSGVTGSGKTTVAQHLLERLGAVRVRSDVERKRRAGLAATEPNSGRSGSALACMTPKPRALPTNNWRAQPPQSSTPVSLRWSMRPFSVARTGNCFALWPAAWVDGSRWSCVKRRRRRCGRGSRRVPRAAPTRPMRRSQYSSISSRASNRSRKMKSPSHTGSTPIPIPQHWQCAAKNWPPRSVLARARTGERRCATSMSSTVTRTACARCISCGSPSRCPPMRRRSS